MNTSYDCVVIGGGPAGTFAAKLLADRDFSTLIIEKRSAYTEKVCGGFVPYKAIQILSHNGIDREKLAKECGNTILITDSNQSGKREKIAYPHGKYGIGVYRHVFDRYLSEEAIQAGAEMLFSQPVSLQQIHYDSIVDIFSLSLPCGVIRTRHLIIATGATGLLPQKCSSKQYELLQRRTVGVSEIVCCTSTLPRDTLMFHCPNLDSHDYFWMIPLSNNAWNIGYWMEQPNKTIKQRFTRYKHELFDPYCKNQSVIYPLRGALLGNVNLRDLYPSKTYVIGDAGGNNAQTTGEGIRFAFESALKAAMDISNTAKALEN